MFVSLSDVVPAVDPGRDQAKVSAGPTDASAETPESTLDAEIASYVARATSSNLAEIPAYRAFKSQIDRYPLLSAQAQDELFTRIMEGRRADEELSSRRFGPREMAEYRRLRQKVREGEEAVEYLVGSNLRLVLVIAGDLASGRLGDRAFSQMPDIVQEGNVGLMEAVKAYDPSRGVPFHTYAARKIRERVRDSLNTDQEIRVPASWKRVARIAAGVASRLHSELGREPTIDEIRDEATVYCMEWAYKRIRPEHAHDPEEGARAVLKKAGILAALRDLEQVLQITGGSLRLDAPVGDDGTTTAIDLMVLDADEGGAFDSAELSELREALMLALEGLKDREREIILLRYGFVDEERWTYARLGEKFGVTAERIRQIEQKVLNRLTSPTAQYVHLSAFLDTQIEVADTEPKTSAADWARQKRRGRQSETQEGK